MPVALFCFSSSQLDPGVAEPGVLTSVHELASSAQDFTIKHQVTPLKMRILGFPEISTHYPLS